MGIIFIAFGVLLDLYGMFRLRKNALIKSMNEAYKKKICLIRQLAESYFILA